MTQCEQVVALFKENGNILTLGQIMKTTLGCEYRARFTDLRKRGYKIELIHKDREFPSQNTYRFLEPIKFEQSGQAIFT